MSSPHQVAESALSLRGWALRLLSDGNPGPAPVAGETAWTVFLDVERCALPLQERARSSVAEPSGPGPAVLKRAATAELKRVLSARGQLRLLDRMAGSLDTAAVVLKGGVAVCDPLPLDVMDVDLLVRDSDLSAFAAAADEHGYGRMEEDRVGPLSDAHHLANRLLPHSVPVEFHHRVPLVGDETGLRARAVPLGDLPHSLRLAPPDHLWHLLVHAAVQHPFRRGRIRDLLLTARALGECSPEESSQVRTRLADHLFAEELAGVLEASAGLLAGRAAADPFRAMAAANYLMAARPYREGAIPGDLQSCVSVLVGGRADRAEMRARLWRNPRAPSEVALIARVQRRLPWLGGGVRRASRILRFAAVAPRATRIAGWARRLAARTSGAGEGPSS